VRLSAGHEGKNTTNLWKGAGKTDDSSIHGHGPKMPKKKRPKNAKAEVSKAFTLLKKTTRGRVQTQDVSN